MYFPLQVMFAITLLTPALKTFIYFFHFNLSITYKEQTTALSFSIGKTLFDIISNVYCFAKKNK